MIQQAIKMIPKKEGNTIVNVVGVNEQEKMFKSGIYVEHFWVIMLKETLWVLAAEMGRGGCKIFIGFSPTF